MQIGLAPCAADADESRVRFATAAVLLLSLFGAAEAAVTTRYSAAGMTVDGTICLDAATGAVLSESKADWPGHPASVTKLMTFLLVLEDIRDRKISLASRVVIGREPSREIGSKVWLAPRENFSIEELLYALMLQSANDAAVALAVDREGSVPAFVARMNRRAAELGMTRTHYVTPNGMTQGRGPHDDSTARDLGKLCVALCRMPEALRFTGSKTYTFRRPLKPVDLTNHNHLLTLYPGCDGLKTGWTEAANASIATTAREGERRVIVVVLGCDSPGGAKAAQRLRDKLAADLMTEGFTKLAAREAAKPKQAPAPILTATPLKNPIIAKKEAGFWDWLGDLFSF
jgi:D-alanyl-D-alanine carboxypeptidase (penicillin-binding protein 5/6)